MIDSQEFEYNQELTAMQHITTLDLTLKPVNDGNKSPAQTAALGPFFQGALLEKADSKYVEWLHALTFNPYSQYVCKGPNDTVIWRISALNDEAAANIVEPLRNGGDVIELRALPEKYEIVQSTMEVVSQKSLLDVIAAENPGKIKMQFVTPTSFKSKGSYEIMPTARLVLQNLLMHYSGVYEGDKEIDADTIEYIDQHVRISSYDLRSQYFANVAREGRKVPAFVGSITLSIDGPKPMVGLVHMLLKFGEFSGVGIKTSMGMGGFKCI